MNAGVKIIGDSGSVQLDETYANLQLAAKGSFTAPNTGAVGYVQQITVPVENGIIFLWSNQPTACIAISDSGGDRTFSVLAFPNATVYWYVFGRATAKSDFGLNVYDASGGIVFSSDHLPMNVQSMYSTSGAPITGASIAVPSGNWAFCFSDPGVIMWSSGTGGGTVTNAEYWCHALSGTTLSIQPLKTRTLDTYIRDAYFQPKAIVMIDVTHA